ncbi:MAG TPA: GNVR domain-containing protein, partial [Longimicrobiales bacterium]
MSNNLPIEPDKHSIVESGYNAIPRGLDVGGAASPFNSGPPAAKGGIGRYLATLGRFKWWALLILALGTGTGVVLSRLVKPTYLVQSKIWIDGGSTARGPIEEGQLMGTNSWIDLLKSYAVLDYVVETQRLYLEVDPAHNRVFNTFALKERFRPGDYRVKLSENGREHILETKAGVFVEKAAVGDSLGGSVGFLWIPGKVGIRQAKSISFTVHRPRDRARKLGQTLVTNIPKAGTFIQLELRGTEPPVRLAATLNALVDRFVELAAELKASRLNEFAKILGDQLRVAEQNLGSAEIALESTRVNTITQPTESPGALAAGTAQTNSPLTQTFVTLKLQQEQLEQDREALQRATIRAQDSVFSSAELEVIGAVQGSTEMKTALTELATKRAGLRALQYRYTNDHPDVRRALGEIAVLERETIPTMVRSLILELSRREKLVADQINAASTEMREIPPRVMEEARLARQVGIADNIYTMLRQRHEEARLAALSSTPDLRVLDKAAVPFAPVKDERTRIIIMAVAASLALIIGGVLMMDKLDPRVRFPEEVTHGLRLPILAAIPRLKTRNGAVSSDAENTTHVIEAFRTLRLGLLQARGDQSCCVAAITSPGTGDGKSFVAMNLAAALADQGYRTLLIDGDNRRGGLHRLVGATRMPGLMEVLGGT